MIDLARRINIPELMDSADLGTTELQSTLQFLSITNRYLGGNRVLFDYLREWSQDWTPGQKLTFLDIGTGNADTPITIAQWGRDRGFNFHIKAIDSTPVIAAIAKQNVHNHPEVEVVEADFFSLAKGNQTVDYVLGSLFLHHLPDERLIEALALCDRLARRGIIFNDLLRSRMSFYGVKTLTALFGNRIVRNDGPLSVRRAFMPEELDILSRQAGLSYLHTRRHPFFRLSLAGQKEGLYA